MASLGMKKSKTTLKKGPIDYQTYPMTSKFLIHIVDSLSYQGLSDHKKRLIQTIWDKEQKRRGGRLHEGMILSALHYDKNSLTGQFVPYKCFLAQLCDPSLKPDLKIVPVSLSGLTLTESNLILAKRASWVAEYPDHYELAPSGGVRSEPSPLDIKEQLLDELKEEIGVPQERVKKVKFFAMVRDIKSDSIELCAEVHIKPCLVLSSSSEYTQVISIPTSEIGPFLKKHPLLLVPLSAHILKLKKLIA